MDNFHAIVRWIRGSDNGIVKTIADTMDSANLNRFTHITITC